MRLQLCPALMDWTVFLVLFAVLYGAGERGLSDAQCAWLGGISQIAYLTASLVAGVMLTRRNARRLVLGATVMSSTFGVICLMLTDFRWQLVAMVIFGASLAFFFNAFQTFMRGETVPGKLANTVGRYTLAWSLGASLGFLSSGSVYALGPVALSLVTVTVGAVVLITLLTYRHRPHEEASAEEHVETTGPGGRPVHPGYVWVAWCMIFTGMFVQRPVQSLFPAICARQGIAPWLASVPLFIHMTIQGIWGFGVSHFATWRYRRLPIIVVHAAAAFGFALVFLVPVFSICAVVISLSGLYTGFVYFAAVYYASNSGHRSRNIGVNECFVGLGSFAGLFVSEWWMKVSGNAAAMYAVCAAALLVSLALQMILLAVRRRPTAV